MPCTIRSRLLLPAIFLLAGAAPLLAQSSAGTAVGERVRIRTAQEPDLWRHGTLRGATEDSLLIELEGAGTVTLPVTKVNRLEMSLGRRNRAGAGAAIGFGVGLGLGLLVGGIAASSDCFGCADAGAGAFLSAGLLLGGLGAGIGLLAGAASSSEGWQPVGPAASRQESVAWDGYRLGLSIDRKSVV